MYSIFTSQQTWSGFSPTIVPDNNRLSGLSPKNVYWVILHTFLVDDYSANMYLKEICFYTNVRNHLCDLFHGTFHFYLDFYLIFNGGFLYKAIFSFRKTESKYEGIFVQNIKVVSRENHCISPMPSISLKPAKRSTN